MIVVVGFMSHVLIWNIVNSQHQQNLAALNVQIYTAKVSFIH